MVRNAAQRVLAQSWKAMQSSAAEFSTRAAKERKVAVLGAAGGIGQPLSLLMKVSACITIPMHVCDRAWRATMRLSARVLLLDLLFPPVHSGPQMNPQVSQLSLYDVAGTRGVGADVSHINSRAQVKVRSLLS